MRKPPVCPGESVGSPNTAAFTQALTPAVLPILPEVRLVQPGATLRLCTCGSSPQLPDCSADCSLGLSVPIAREQHLLLCRCGQSRRLPYCDGSHNPPAPSLTAKWRRFWVGY
ncbi:CDGSH iron-sulfur domain-containing protein [Pseudomonas cavernicola]|uniref:CDGSH iron-sulfur domain-containing protein n=2 Tax=Pseudomonas cavernicola TaxID=2320866 RepID=A0A418XCL1_9PSED|nr:CDGSH iron-sulfur domain-containing protein [Pseudomonas cavernicola]